MQLGHSGVDPPHCVSEARERPQEKNKNDKTQPAHRGKAQSSSTAQAIQPSFNRSIHVAVCGGGGGGGQRSLLQYAGAMPRAAVSLSRSLTVDWVVLRSTLRAATLTGAPAPATAAQQPNLPAHRAAGAAAVARQRRFTPRRWRWDRRRTALGLHGIHCVRCDTARPLRRHPGAARRRAGHHDVAGLAERLAPGVFLCFPHTTHETKMLTSVKPQALESSGNKPKVGMTM